MFLTNDQQTIEVIVKTSKGWLQFIGGKRKVAPLIVRVCDITFDNAMENAVTLATKDISIYVVNAKSATKLLPSYDKAITDDGYLPPSALVEFEKTITKVTEMKCGDINLTGNEIKIIVWDLSRITANLMILPASKRLTGSALVVNDDNIIVGFHTAVDGFVKYSK